MKPHLLYIAFWYPPSRASGVYRALATTQAFVDDGWDVTVITTSREFLEDEIGSVDPSLLDYIPSQVNVVRVPFAFDMDARVDIRGLGWWRANFPTLWRRLRERSAPLRAAASLLKGETEQAHEITDKYVAWIDPVVRAGKQSASERPVDHILATGNPYSSFEAARLLGGVLGVQFSIDYRDPWTIDVFTGRIDNADRMTTEVERDIIAETAFCFHVNNAIADAYREKYPQSAAKHRVVYNGYDSQSIPPPSGPATGPIRFGVLGTLNDRWPTEAIFKAWADCRPQLPKGSEIVLGGHLGYFARSQDLLEAYLPDESMGFRYVGPIAKADVADFYASLDVVVLPVPGGPMVTSGKVFEALAVGKPIMCVQRAGGGARQLIEGWPLATAADPDPDSVRAAILATAEAAQSLDPEVSQQAQSEAAKYERKRTIGTMVQAITDVTPRRQPA